MTLPPLPMLPTVFTTTEGDVHKLLKTYGQQCREEVLEFVMGLIKINQQCQEIIKDLK